MTLRSFDRVLAPLGVALLALGLGAPNLSRADNPAPAAKPAASTAPAGSVEALVTERKFQDAILKVDAMRAASKTRVADAESEFWAAKAELGMNLQEAARDRFHLLAKTYPKDKRAMTALVEAAITRLRGLGEGKNLTEQQKAAVAAAAKELEGIADQNPSNQEDAPRALYIAGNARKMSGDLKQAFANWERVRAEYSKTDYPPKATALLAAYAAADFDVPRAKALLTECVSKYHEGESAQKCRKNLARMSVVGTPAPAFVTETWLNSPPQDIAALRGNVVLVFFFATWCPHCKAAMPEIKAILDKYKDKPLKAVGITFNAKGQTTESAKAFVEDATNSFSWPAGVDLGGRTSTAYEGSNVPTLLLVDKKGVIRWIDHPVYLQEKMVAKLLAE